MAACFIHTAQKTNLKPCIATWERKNLDRRSPKCTFWHICIVFVWSGHLNAHCRGRCDHSISEKIKSPICVTVSAGIQVYWCAKCAFLWCFSQHGYHHFVKLHSRGGEVSDTKWKILFQRLCWDTESTVISKSGWAFEAWIQKPVLRGF